MLFYRSVRIVLATLFILPFFYTVHAQDAAPAELAAIDKPLVVIRFTEKVVPYENALARAVAQAENHIDAPFYDVVSIYPENGDYFDSGKDAAEQKAEEVIQTIQRTGVPRERTRLSQQKSDAATYQEVHVFIR